MCITHYLDKLHNRRTLGHDDPSANIFYIVLHIEDVTVYISLKDEEADDCPEE